MTHESRSALTLSVVTQTPAVIFRSWSPEREAKGTAGEVDLGEMKEDVDYYFPPSGLTRTVLPFLRWAFDRQELEESVWVSLNRDAPRNARLGSIRLKFVAVESSLAPGYGELKESLWLLFHDVPHPDEEMERIWEECLGDYHGVNRALAEAVEEVEREVDPDVYYVHDFQLTPLASKLRVLKPKLFRWHIPFTETSLRYERVCNPLVELINQYDAVVVSTRRYSENMRRAGVSVPTHVLYPYLDRSQYREPDPLDVKQVSERLGLGDEDRVVLVVARMDPIKGQDRAVKAMRGVIRSVDSAKLVLVGDGSFSSSRSGLALPKGERWRASLMQLTQELGLEGRVILAGYLSSSELRAMYSRADVVLLPSLVEGFGLAVIEGWFYRKPVVVSRSAGVAELVREGWNGFTYDPDDVDALAELLAKLLSDEELAERMGSNGYETAEQCTVEAGARREMEIVREVSG
ncbi:MAG: glycosyltransferase family 4 protein [Nitrososphaerota archaeon]